MRRIGQWNAAMRDASPAQFRRLLKNQKPEIENAIAAGRSLAMLLMDGRLMLTGVDDVQLKRYRRRYRVPRKLVGIMYAVATGKLSEHMLNARLDAKFPFFILPSGKIRFVKRCALCSKRTCRCFPIQEKRTVRPAREPRIQPVLVSVRGIPVERLVGSHGRSASKAV